MSPKLFVPAFTAGKALMLGASPRRRRARVRRAVPLLLATGTLAVSVLVAVPNGAGAQTEAPSGYSSAASTYCARIPAARVSSIVGATVALLEAVDVKRMLECIYEGGLGIVGVDKEPGAPSAHGVTLAKAEATAASAFPNGTKVTFSPLPSLSPSLQVGRGSRRDPVQRDRHHAAQRGVRLWDERRAPTSKAGKAPAARHLLTTKARVAWHRQAGRATSVGVPSPDGPNLR